LGKIFSEEVSCAQRVGNVQAGQGGQWAVEVIQPDQHPGEYIGVINHRTRGIGLVSDVDDTRDQADDHHGKSIRAEIPGP